MNLGLKKAVDLELLCINFFYLHYSYSIYFKFEHTFKLRKFEGNWGFESTNYALFTMKLFEFFLWFFFSRIRLFGKGVDCSWISPKSSQEHLGKMRIRFYELSPYNKILSSFLWIFPGFSLVLTQEDCSRPLSKTSLKIGLEVSSFQINPKISKKWETYKKKFKNSIIC